MFFTYACRVFATFAAFVFVIGSQTFEAQTTAPAKSTLHTLARTLIDFSPSMAPTSVIKLSDDELDQLFETVSAQQSKDAILFNNIGAAYFQRKKYDKAEESLKRAIILCSSPAFLTNLSIVYDAENRLPEAISAAQSAVSQSPEYPRGRSQLCELLVVSKRNTDAILCYSELSKFSQLDSVDETLNALSYLRAGNIDKAISIVSPLALGTQPTPTMFNILGSAYYKKRRYQAAVDAFKQGVELEPESVKLRYNMAMALAATDNRVGALTQYKFLKEKDEQIAAKLYRNLYRNKIVYVNDIDASKKPN